MKLVELLSEEKIIITEEAVEIPKLTTLSLGDVDYKWNGQTWVKATDNSPASRNIVSRLTNTFKSLNPGKAVFDAATASPVNVKDRWLVNLADESFSFAKQADADKFISRLRGGNSIDRALRVFNDGDFRRVGRSTWSKFKIGAQMSPDQIDKALKRNNDQFRKERNQQANKGPDNLMMVASFSDDVSHLAVPAISRATP